MIHTRCPLTARENPVSNIFVEHFRCPEIAASVQPGQFVNIRVSDSDFPLLRRPFSVYHADVHEISIIFDVRGTGTGILASKNIGEFVDIIGPLGCSFGVDGDDFDTALLVAGGLGVAPLPLVARSLAGRGKRIDTFLGASTRKRIVSSFLEGAHLATDDGTSDFRGTVVDLLRSHLVRGGYKRPKIFGCGPNAMLAALSRLAEEHAILCEISLESPMACGVGLCQGCPVELSGDERKYGLVCKDGPVFNSRKVRIC
jgi:dihydroorotate dehydrogenase electron transfer subunit